jgi:hypothetical protein
MRGLVLVSVALLLGLLAVGCDGDDRAAEPRTEPPAPAAAEPPLEPALLFQNPPQYIGDTVTVRGEVTELVGQHGMLLDPGLVVVSETPLPDVFSPGTDVLVTGLVEWFDLSEAERITGADVDWDQYRRFAGRPSLIAASVERVE